MFNVGDKVKIADWYLSLYPIWGNSVKDKEAVVEKVVHKLVHNKELDKETRGFYRSIYGDAPVYDLFGLYIRYPGESCQYLVSQLGYEKV